VSVRHWVDLARRARGRGPRAIFHRLRIELADEAERWKAPRRSRAFDEAALLRVTGHPAIESLWASLAVRPFAVAGLGDIRETLDTFCPGERARLEAAGARALRREVDLLRSGPLTLGAPTDWHTGFKTGSRWPVA